MDIVILRVIGLLAIAMIVAIIARRIRLPYTVGLVVAGICITLLDFRTGARLTHDFIYDVVLPPLLFEAALSIHWSELRRDVLPVLILAIAGVIISAIVVASGLFYGLHWPLPSALVFGVLIAATDPVSVIAMFKDTGVGGRLRLLVESESLLNDGVAAVLFALALSWAHSSGQIPALSDIAGALAVTIGGGIAIGLACGAGAIVIAGRTSDHLVETTLSIIAAFGSFQLAEHFDTSGVLATVSAGLLMGNVGCLSNKAEAPLSSTGREFVIGFWEFAAFIANSLIFLLIGLAVADISFDGMGLNALTFVVALVLIGRAASVYPLCLPLAWSRWAIPMAKQHVLWWGGLRGALSLALVLSLPSDLAFRNQIIIAAFAVVAFSVVVAGLTMPWLLKKLGFSADMGSPSVQVGG